MEVQGFPLDDEKVRFFGSDWNQALMGCSSLIVMTEFDEFKEYPFNTFKTHMSQETPISFFDLRNYLDIK